MIHYDEIRQQLVIEFRLDRNCLLDEVMKSLRYEIEKYLGNWGEGNK